MSAPPHVSVMLNEAIEALGPVAGGVYVDATLGAGGYARAILAAAPCVVYAFDRDPTAIARAMTWDAEFGGRLHLVEAPFGALASELQARGVEAIDGVVYDLGVSSMQLDEAERGFSFRFDGPLSMRMDRGKPDAADVVNEFDVGDLAAVFRVYGEEKKAGPIARAIVAERERAPIETTGRLAAIVEAAAPKRPGERTHPATQTFQALRIFVNDELGELVRSLVAAERLLRPGGRLVVVTFHSLEDRIVKRFFIDRSGAAPLGSRHVPEAARETPTIRLTRAKPLAPSEHEVLRNPRARSAKLRAAERLATPARADDWRSLSPHGSLSRLHQTFG